MPEWTHHDIKLGYVPKPFQAPHPPIAVSGMSPWSGFDDPGGVARLHSGLGELHRGVVGGFHWPAYLKGAEQAQRAADPDLWRVARSIFVADTDAEAEAFVKTPDGPYDFYYSYLCTIFERAGMRAAFVVEKDDDPAQLTHEALRDRFIVYGSPETVARKVLALREKVGEFGTLLYAAHDWGDEKARMKNSMRLMAEEVMPRVNRALGARAAAD